MSTMKLAFNDFVNKMSNLTTCENLTQKFNGLQVNLDIHCKKKKSFVNNNKKKLPFNWSFRTVNNKIIISYKVSKNNQPELGIN